ncbi:hypothetical protein OJ996_09120 [Luteolibacter sp. GHJ8]|uniref:Uncharacterized protein n=1 Tax=Luteolibacter rhizosphaerae TaxID=2989719 RepID=A0ABT3G2E2_9BACT|nr:hypothetical protein [Luteolibacter rhizosphaerae]MCW1913734.1 hypothetical protein [Luteolibacter rhizosphaerae]
MSVFNDRAELLADRLRSVVGLESFSWVVDRDADLKSEFEKATKKKLGLGVIRWMGGANPDPNSSRLAITSGFNITLFLKPILRRGKPPGDDLMELTARAVHHWFPAETPTKLRYRFEVLSTAPIPPPPEEPHLQVFQIVAQSVTQFSSAIIQTTP